MDEDLFFPAHGPNGWFVARRANLTEDQAKRVCDFLNGGEVRVRSPNERTILTSLNGAAKKPPAELAQELHRKVWETLNSLPVEQRAPIEGEAMMEFLESLGCTADEARETILAAQRLGLFSPVPNSSCWLPLFRRS